MLGESYFRLNKKFYKTAKRIDVLKAREKYPQIYSLLDYMPRILRIIHLSYYYLKNNVMTNVKAKDFIDYYSDLDSHWNIKKAAKCLNRNEDDVNTYKLRCMFICKLITNYIEINNFKYRAGALTLKDEVEN